MLNGFVHRAPDWRVEVYLPERGPLADELERRPRTTVRVITYDLGRGEELASIRRRPLLLLGRLFGRFIALVTVAWRVRGASAMYVNTIRGATAAWAAWLVGVPVVWHIRGTEADYSAGMFRSFRLWSVGRISACAVAVSRDVERQLVEAGVPPSKIRTVYNGVDAEEIRASVNPDEVVALRARLTEGHRGPLVVTMGRLKPDKGILDALEAAGIAAESRAFTLAAIGGPIGDANPWWEEITTRRSAIPESVRIVLEDYTDRPTLHFAAADIYLLLSHDEGFNRTIIEAMALGKTCVVTRVGGNAEAVADGETGIVVPPRAPSEAATALVRLIDDPEFRDRSGAAARERVIRLFTLEAMCDEMHGLIVGSATKR